MLAEVQGGLIDTECRFCETCIAAGRNGILLAHHCQCHHGRKEGDSDFAVEHMEWFASQYGK